MINSKVVTFTPTSPNVKTNLMATHAGPSFSDVGEANDHEMIEIMEEI